MAWTPESLAAALGVLAAAVAGVAVIMARTYVQVANILQGLHRAGVPMRGGQGAAMIRAVPVPATPKAPVPQTKPTWLPNWDQLNDPLPTGQQDPQAMTDCGEECVAECVYAIKGVPMTAGDIRFLLGGANRPGTTTAADLVRAFTICHIKSHAVALSAGDARGALTDICKDGRVAIILGEWVSAGFMHWVVCWRVDSDGIMVNDPWHGVRHKLGWTDFLAHYQGYLVDVQERG